MIETTYVDWKQQEARLLYVYTPMCGTCQVASKMLTVCEEVLQETFTQLNANYAPELMHEHQIESVPCLLIQNKEGNFDKIYAFHSVPYLLEQIKKS